MYEPYDVLKIKSRANITSAVQELEFRKSHKEWLPLPGIGGTGLCLVQTEELKQRIISINSLYQQVRRDQKVSEVILLDAFHSATIEGARTTVEKIRKSFEAPSIKDDKMVVNTVRGMRFAYENLITPENLRTLWEIVVRDVCENQRMAGIKFRSGMVYVGSASALVHTPAQPEEIEPCIQKLFTFTQNSGYSKWLTAAILHFYFVYIHPFCDGNGRMTRILTQSWLLHQGLDKIRYLPLSRTINHHLARYYSTLSASEQIHSNGRRWMDITPFLDYLLEMMEECMIISIQEDHKLSENQSLLLSKMQKRGTGAEITVIAAARICKVTPDTARKILNALTDFGYLEKEKRQRKNIYRLIL